MANRQWDNLLVLVTIYLVVHYVSSYFEKVTAPETPGQDQYATTLFNNFIHYVLLGYFSAKYWMFLIALAILTNVLQFFRSGLNLNEFVKKGLLQVISAKFIGLLVGIVLSRRYPMKVNLWTIIKEVV